MDTTSPKPYRNRDFHSEETLSSSKPQTILAYSVYYTNSECQLNTVTSYSPFSVAVDTDADVAAVAAVVVRFLFPEDDGTMTTLTQK